MNLVNSIRRFGLAFGLGLGVSSAAVAITDTNFTYSPAKTASYFPAQN